MAAAPKLPLSSQEKANLRALKIKLNEIADMEVSQLALILQTTEQRAGAIRGLAQFQSIPSIGPKVAQRLVDLGYCSLESLKNRDGAGLIDQWEQASGYWEDPCLEDAFRCLVHHANNPGSSRAWHDFTAERQQYRVQHGYPASRPAVAWHRRLE
ncbi:helix-hairpin-helix domain-containing protein [Paenibacillus oenotherae]|uniref:Helix-hairpin-helix domain-containing protein n=1 Tax=Paenibacillus oenotherae TaxID=1435645 RepID=A0ABS7D616_9BACL|nr:helix-hairpin-helix domain-containing protein [Paenibacillus oenotherae]MBW7475387.1 helix-hairpin-helix domain-containing protein [Paenibacillus oenotherae]